MNASMIQENYDLRNERFMEIPQNYSSIVSHRVDTAWEIDPVQIFEQNTYDFIYLSLWKININRKIYYTPKPISVMIYRDGEFYFAENENLAVCGTGNTLENAIKDFCLHIIHFYNYYKKIDKNKLIGDALRLKRLYNKLFIEK